MAPPRDDDLDWLYGRDRPGRPSRSEEPEHTRVMGPVDPRNADHGQPRAEGSRPPGSSTRPGSQQSQPARPPVQPPPPVQPAPTGRNASGRPAKRKHPVRRFFAVLGILVLVCLIWLIGVPVYAWSQVSRVDNDPSGSRPGNQPGSTFLLLGSDSRQGLTKEEQKKLGTGHAAGKRTDTIMILSVPPGGEPALISIPRDSYLPIPGHGSNKINAAYAFGGPKLITETVEQNTGLRIDGYVEVGFGGFVNVIDALDGIRMCLDKPVKDKDSHIDLKAGCQTLGGADALGYVRQRHADPLGDLGRVQRQRQMLSAMVKKGASPASVINPVRYWKLNMAGASALTLGKSTSSWEMLRFVSGMRKVSGGSGYTLTVPVSSTNASTGAGSAVLWDKNRSAAMFDDLARGDTSDMKKYQK